MSGRYVPNRGAEAELAKAPGVTRHMLAAARAVKESAEAAAPVGHSRRGVAKRFAVGQDGGAVYVTNSDAFFHLVEWGSAKNPPYAPLRRGVTAAGLRLDEQPK